MKTMPLDQDSIDKLKLFIDVCKQQPDVLHFDELKFFRDYIVSLGATLPPRNENPTVTPTEEPSTTKPMASEPEVDPKETGDIDSDVESELEFDTTGCIEPDVINEETQIMGDSTKEVSVEEEDQADVKRIEAVQEGAAGNYDKAVELYTEAIKLNPQSALLFAKRGQAYLNMSKPNACIKDCTKALELNCDSAAAYKFRGRAYRLLGEWEKSAKDLRQAAKIDFDEQTDEWLKEVQPNALKIEQHNIKIERKKADKEEKVKREKLRAYREAHAKAATQPEATGDEEGLGGMPGMGGMGGMGNLYKLLQDPEILQAFQDPEVEAAFKDISTNPAKLASYQNNPKIKAVIEKLSSKLGSQGGAGGFPGFPGGMPNFGGFGGTTPSTGGMPEEDPLD
nr:hsc70-interacting protein-like [Onthophagus taurus]